MHTRGTEETESLALSMDRAAKLLGLSKRKFYQLVLSGEIASLKVGSRRLVRPMDLQEFLARKVAAAR